MTQHSPRSGARRRPPGPPTRGRQSVPGTTTRYRNQLVFVPDGYFVVGRIISAHGLRGEVRVELHTDFPERFASGRDLYYGDQLVPVEIESAREHKSSMLLMLRGVSNRSDAEAIRGEWLYIAENDAESLEPDTFWVHDIVGLAVETVDGLPLGTVAEVLFTGANEVYLVTPADGINRGREILLPAIADVVRSVDLDAGKIQVQLMPGLIDD